MKLMTCVREDFSCSISIDQARKLVDLARQGLGPPEIEATYETLPQHPMTAIREIGPAVQIPTCGAPSRGPADAPVTIVVFVDYECPYSAGLFSVLDPIVAEYPEELRLVVKQFPLPEHPHAQVAATAALAAQDEGRFWPLHHWLCSKESAPPSASRIVELGAIRSGIKRRSLLVALESDTYRGRVESDRLDGVRAGVTGTPAIFVNGKLFPGERSPSMFRSLIKRELEGRKFQFLSRDEPQSGGIAVAMPSSASEPETPHDKR